MFLTVQDLYAYLCSGLTNLKLDGNAITYAELADVISTTIFCNRRNSIFKHKNFFIVYQDGYISDGYEWKFIIYKSKLHIITYDNP